MPLKTLSYPKNKWDEALGDAKALGWVFKGEPYHYRKEDGKLEAQRAW
jgi:hypothetical protein